MSGQLSFFDTADNSAPLDVETVYLTENVPPDTSALRKARGAFFTPPEMVAFITDWAVRSATDKVLEPSCGDAAFLVEAGLRLQLAGATSAALHAHLHGIELHADSAAEARAKITGAGLAAVIQTGDFFDRMPSADYDCVIGNPPYVRYQSFTGNARAKGLEAALRHGVRLTGLANSWAAFVIHASQFLKPGGRLGLVLPAELLSVNYAAQVRRFLLERFAKVRLVMFDELVFPGVLEEVVLLLAEGTGPSPCFEVHQARDLSALRKADSTPWLDFTPERGGKWTPALLPMGAFDLFRAVVNGGGFSPLLTWGETTLGAVTGNNAYFTMTAEEAATHKIPKRDLRPISPPGSRHLRGLTFSQRDWAELAEEGAACFLFSPDSAKPSAAALRYIQDGDAQGVNETYKCRNRTPWWRVPLVRVPDVLLTYMDHERPRLVTNEARVLHLNSIYGVTLRHGLRELGRDLLPIATLNSVTLLAAEMVGRAYGGGLLKLEPSEADRWLVPSEKIVRAAHAELRRLHPKISTAVKANKVAAAVELVDQVLLTSHLGFTTAQITQLRDGRAALFSRRNSRSRGGRAEDDAPHLPSKPIENRLKD